MPPVLQVEAGPRKGAPTLGVIVGLKVLTGVVMLMSGFLVWCVRDMNLADFQQVLQDANLTPLLATLGSTEVDLGAITPATLRMISLGALVYGVVSLVLGAGLWSRAGWAGWLAIGETAIFVPVEIWDLARQFSLTITFLLVVNSAILWYLVANRRRLFPLSSN